MSNIANYLTIGLQFPKLHTFKFKLRQDWLEFHEFQKLEYKIVELGKSSNKHEIRSKYGKLIQIAVARQILMD